MKIYNKLESLGFFKWLSETHNLKATDMTPEHLDKLPLNDIHRTVCNSMALRWFRDKYSLQASSIMFSNGKYDAGITRCKGTQSVWGVGPIYNTYEEAELECLKKLIEIVKDKQ